MGNGLRFRITRNDGHKPKTRKGNHTSRLIRTKKPRWLLQVATASTKNKTKAINKMKTRTNLKSSSRRHLASLALLLATVSQLAFAPPAARASTERPFHANFTTQFETVLEFP